MKDVATVDLKSFISNAIQEVFDMMLSMELTADEAGAAQSMNGNRIVGAVSFAGQILGSVSMHVGKPFAQLMTAAMLGMESDEIDSEEEVHDVIGELINMIGGDLKSRMCDAGFDCALSIPSITSGSDFRIEPMNWARHEVYSFRHRDEITQIEVSIKTAG